ncbi:MAG: type II secretion system F family protein, partial [Candidatus Omnitrophica bacterium]|nr:type II secretion system F family protein [Candidatus Omnitrophota bacterium]
MQFILYFIGFWALVIAGFVAFFYWSNYLHVSRTLVAAFCREVSIMLDAGIPLLRALKILAERTSHPKLKSIVKEIHTSVENGNTVAAAMANHPKVFDDMMIGIIKVGETGGILDESLRRLSEHLEKTVALRRKVILAWTYPALVIVVASVVTLILVCYFIPKIIEPLKSLNPDVELPYLTQLVANAGQFVLGNWFWILLGLILFIFALSAFHRTPMGRYGSDWIKLHFPVVGNLLARRIVAARVSNTFATLVHCGIPIISCLRIVSQTQPNYFVARSFQNTVRVVEEGGNLVQPLEESKIYPPLMIDMLAIGEESGTLDTVLDKISQHYTDEVDAALD